MPGIVECLSSASYAETPIALVWQGQRRGIAAVLSRGRTPDSLWFRVQIDSGEIFELEYRLNENRDQAAPAWQIKPL